MLMQTPRKKRRQFVKRTGRQFIKGIAALISRQSLVEDRPIYPARQFPFLVPIEANWTRSRDELDKVLIDRASPPLFHEISPDQKYISKGNGWKVFSLAGSGVQSRG